MSYRPITVCANRRQHLSNARVAKIAPTAISQTTTHASICPSAPAHPGNVSGRGPAAPR